VRAALADVFLRSACEETIDSVLVCASTGHQFKVYTLAPQTISGLEYPLGIEARVVRRATFTLIEYPVDDGFACILCEPTQGDGLDSPRLIFMEIPLSA
jgi:hypothetical protein